ncbi:hypothetical protein [Sphingomonas sp. CROZ-RG-20F-R02-07]|uniref:hypothetical protein n=1 Tax=Sphingomonas sp. CROZ-RG-20F-R02-07 TaxID=2914832 RepID=UPI001F55F453|nr:hypothetical protein [Sphingomonas sp. CROZ-RG-20F-R02-07]
MLVVLIGAALASGSAASSGTAMEPPAAIAAADAASSNGRTGRFVMTVVSTAKTARGTFLNSTDDYRRPDDLTFDLSRVAANELAKRYGAPPEIYFKGRHIVVDGVVRRNLIVNTVSGRAHSVNRYQHVVQIQHPQQIVAVD